jgi:hypothetical protein
MYLVVMVAKGYVAVGEASHTQVTHVAIPKTIEVLDVDDYDGRIVGLQNIIHLRLCQHFVSQGGEKSAATEGSIDRNRNSSERWVFLYGLSVRRWNAGRNNNFHLVGVGQDFILKFVKPRLCVILRSFPGEHLGEDGSPESRGFSIAKHRDIGPHSFSGLDADFGPDRVVPYVWPLFDLEVFGIIRDVFAGQAALPKNRVRTDTTKPLLRWER